VRFDLNQKKFPSTTHKSIWHAAVFMAPFCEVIPTQVTGRKADELHEGEKNLYQFMTDLYSDMYDNPEAYHLPVGEYDIFMNGRNRESLTGKDKLKESLLRNKFQRAIQFYQKLLFEIGSTAEPEGGSHNLVMDKSVLSEMIIKHNVRILRGEQERRAEALSNLGLQIAQSESKMTISNKEYPKMLAALSVLCKAETKKFVLTNFLRCDFRGLTESFKPSFEDAVSILPDNFKRMAMEMDDFMRRVRCGMSVQPLKNTTLLSQWKLGYSLQGKTVYSFHSDTDSLEAFACFNHHRNISRMGYLLKEESDLLYTWFYDKIPTRLCSCRYNRVADIGGRKKRICGLMNKMDVINPDGHDLQNLKRIIEIYLDKIKK
jgi:hypothetical protein